MKKNLFSSVFQCNIHTYVLGCPYILNIGFKLMPAGSACAIIKVAHMQKFKAISQYLTGWKGGGIGEILRYSSENLHVGFFYDGTSCPSWHKL